MIKKMLFLIVLIPLFLGAFMVGAFIYSSLHHDPEM